MSTATAATPATEEDRHIRCAICDAKIHSVEKHLVDDHKNDANAPKTVAEYQAKYPGAPLLSPALIEAMEKRRLAKVAAVQRAAENDAATAQSVSTEPLGGEATKATFHELFELGSNAATLNAKGNPIPVTVLAPAAQHLSLVPDQDPNYVFNVDILKTLMMGIEMGIPVYLWGHSGVGKTTMFEQLCSRTRRPLLRVQHTANMEESDVVGGWRLRDGKTFFEPGPLVNAMRYGWTYLADEYDFGRPEVTSVYQAVLEGKPLVIKEADPENRVIRPHKHFRIIATGNTNGQGDETGLYAGTNVQNAANYERFGIVVEMPYMDPALEERLVSQQANVPMADAKKLVEFAKRVREAFTGGTMGNPVSPRSLIYAARLGKNKRDYKVGIDLAFTNRLAPTDREAAKQFAQRVFA